MSNDDIRKRAREYEESTDAMKKANIVGDLSILHALSERNFDSKIEEIEGALEKDIQSETKADAIQRICDAIKRSVR